MGKLGENFRIGHRARMRQKFLDDKLTDDELLELLLSYAIPRRDTKPIAKLLVSQFGNVQRILSASVDDLCQIDGIGPNVAIFLRAIREITLLNYKQQISEQPLFHDHKRLENYARLLLMEKREEEFHILYLDSVRRLIKDDNHSKGTSNNVTVYPREILKRALDLNAKFVILMHNHPDGTRFFSTDDLAVTEATKRILDVVGIKVDDHLLVANDLVFSAKNMMLCK